MQRVMRTLHRCGLLVCIAALVLTGAWEPTHTARANSSIIKSIAALADTVGRFEKFESVIQLTETFKNPYDPDEVKLDGVFTSPSGKTATVPGFFFRDFAYEIVTTAASSVLENITKTDDTSWRVRYTPDEIGDWSYVVQVTTGGKTTTSEAQHFTVKTSDNHGFLRLDKRDFRYLVFDDGTPFFGVGLNMGWYDNDETRNGDYVRWLAPFHEAGGNTIRIWMAPWGFIPEWTETGLGNYDKRQDRAFELDKLFEMAEEQGIYIQLALLNHGQFSKTTNTTWDSNPYNAANGGPLKEPVEFATNPTAFKFWAQRLRYIAARWGYSTHLLAWEWWNEVNWTPLSDPNILAPWIAKSAAVLSPLDPYKHLMTHSGSAKSDTAVWSEPSMSITQLHIYEAVDWAYILVDSTRKMITEFKKPFLLGEFGYVNEPTFDPYGIRLRLGLWAGLMGGAMGTGQFWWWEAIHAGNLYQPFRGIAAFVAGEDLAAHSFKAATAKASKTSKADVYGLQSDDYALLWVVSSQFNDTNYKTLFTKNLEKKVENPLQVTFPDVQELTLRVKNLPDGAYIVEWWDTQTGKVIQTDKGTSSAKLLEVPIPTFQTDLAAKVRKAS